MNEVRARSEPQVGLDAQRECWRLRRRHKGAPGRAPGIDRRVRQTEPKAFAQRRAQPVSGDQHVAIDARVLARLAKADLDARLIAFRDGCEAQNLAVRLEGDKRQRGAGGDEHALKIRAVDYEMRRAPPRVRKRPKRHAHEVSAVPRAANAQRLGSESPWAQPVEHAQIMQDVGSVRRQLQAGAHFLENRGALEKRDARAIAGKRKAAVRPPMPAPEMTTCRGRSRPAMRNARPRPRAR